MAGPNLYILLEFVLNVLFMYIVAHFNHLKNKRGIIYIFLVSLKRTCFIF